jgi:hypothetical protein
MTVEKARELLRMLAPHTYLPLPIQNKTKLQKVATILILQDIFSDDGNKTMCAIYDLAEKRLKELNQSVLYKSHISCIFISLILNKANSDY